MPQVKKSALVPYPAGAMYALVNDIESYPEFLPWCCAARILTRKADQLQASIAIAKGPLQKSFVTRNRLRPETAIEIQLVDGPFRKLDGMWRFEALDERASKVALNLDFEFSSRLLALSVGPVFQQIGNTMVDAFCRRARQLYG